MPFRIGRKYARHSYPEPRRAVADPQEFARNFASGPATGQAITTGGDPLVWSAIDAPDGPIDEDVSITALSTGYILVTGVIVVSNDSGAAVDVTVEVTVEDNPLAAPIVFTATVPTRLADEKPGYVSIPITVVTTPTDTPVSTPKHVQVVLTAETNDALEVVALSSTLELYEVVEPTG